jgi:hypothetical protein
MAQDLRNLFEDQPKNQTTKMSEGHEARFLQKLDATLPKTRKTNRFGFLNIAASVVVLLGLSYGAFKYFEGPIIAPVEVVDNATKLKTMGDLSPDLKKVEDYYLASINLELSKIELTPENKELFDGYLLRLEELNAEYDNLNKELNDNGPNPLTIDALINNLKLRLNLLYDLQEKLKSFSTDDSGSETIA